MHSIPILAITLVAHFVSLGSEVNVFPASLNGQGARVLGIAVPLPGLDRVGSPTQAPARPRPVIDNLQETEIDEEDNDSVEKPFALSQTVHDFAPRPGDLPSLVSKPDRVLPGPTTASPVLRC
jgi:hypothetical protein